MRTVFALIKRNRQLFFRDKGMLISSLITPIILIVLYATFLQNVYKDSLQSALPGVMNVSEKLVNGTVAGQLAAALLAVSCVTVTFCVNLTMIQDKASGARKDFDVSPVHRPTLYIGYFFSTVLNSLMVNFLAVVMCLIYVKHMGWYLNGTDIAWIILDVILLVLFGAVLSSIICYPLKTQGQLSAVGTIVSAGYGFVCGAYMPMSSFSSGLRGVFEEMKDQKFPDDAVTAIAGTLDCNPVFRGHVVSTSEMIAVLIGSIVLLGMVYLAVTTLAERKK